MNCLVYYIFANRKLNTMIQGLNLTKSYKDIHVLKGIDIEIKESEIISIIGKSGAGKSTLLHILGTLDLPDEGTLEIAGIKTLDLSEKKLAEFRNRHIGFIFQFHHLLAEFTALENVCIPAQIGLKSKHEVEKQAMILLDYLGLTDRMHHKPHELSGGEAQRVAVARALINKPSVVFADEPTGNLDKQSSETLHQLFLQIRRDFNQTLVIVTHNDELAQLSDRIVKMEDGLLVH